jgi:hypothetical protein
MTPLLPSRGGSRSGGTFKDSAQDQLARRANVLTKGLKRRLPFGHSWETGHDVKIP